MSNLQIIRWAAIHHPDFWQCHLRGPFIFNVRPVRTSDEFWLQLQIGLKEPSIYIPYKIRCDCWAAHSDPLNFDDIPF